MGCWCKFVHCLSWCNSCHWLFRQCLGIIIGCHGDSLGYVFFNQCQCQYIGLSMSICPLFHLMYWSSVAKCWVQLQLNTSSSLFKLVLIHLVMILMYPFSQLIYQSPKAKLLKSWHCYRLHFPAIPRSWDIWSLWLCL